MIGWIRAHAIDVGIVLVGVALAVGIRLSLLDFKSVDYFNYTKVWYLALRTDGYSAFAQSFSNYNLPYLYVLYSAVRLAPELAPWMAIKVPSMIADFVMAGFAFVIVRKRYDGAAIPLLAAFAVLFAPTVILNSALWGQADSIYTCLLLSSVYFLLRREDLLALLSFALAFAFKAQALFLAPLFVGLMLRGQVRWKYALLLPSVYFVMLVPALLAGRSFIDLLQIYPAQAEQYQRLTLHAPTFLAWFPDTGRFYPYFYPAGLGLGVMAAIGIVVAVWKYPGELTQAGLIEFAMICSVLVPFLLPKMHERYFFPADVFAILFAFHFPDYILVPVGMIAVSFLAYQPTLFGVEAAPLGLLALAVFGIVAAVLCHTARDVGKLSAKATAAQ